MKKLSAALVVCAFALTPSLASAQRFGGQVGYGTDVEGISIGARAEFDLTNIFSATPPWSNTMFVPAFDLYFPDCAAGVNCRYWELTVPLVVPVKTPTLNPYFGAGISIARISAGSFDDTETGLAILGGLRFPLAAMTAFTEARITIHDADQLTLSFGLLFGGPKQ